MESVDTGRAVCNVRRATSYPGRAQRAQMSLRRDVECRTDRLVMDGAKGEAAIGPCILEYRREGDLIYEREVECVDVTSFAIGLNYLGGCIAFENMGVVPTLKEGLRRPYVNTDQYPTGRNAASTLTAL